MNEMKMKSKNLMIISIITAIISALVSVFNVDIYLAGTQWMLIAIVFGIYALYVKKD